MLVERSFLDDIAINVTRVWEAFLLSVAMAVPIGMWMSSYRIVGALLEPIVDFIRYLPIPALVPLLIIWFGISEASKIAVLWMGTFFQLVLLIADRAGAQDFAGILVAAGRNQPVDQFGLRVCQNDVSGGHEVNLLQGRLAHYCDDIRLYI